MENRLASPVFLLPVLVLAALLRVWGLDSHSIWTDDSYAIEISAGHHHWGHDIPRNELLTSELDVTTLDSTVSPVEVWTQTTFDTHPPLYFITLRWWRKLWGSSVFSLRLLSVVFSLAAIAALYLSARELNGPRIALLGCFIMAISGTQIQHAQSIRNYTMMLTWVLVACAALLRMQRLGANRRRASALIVGSLLALLTHYLTILALAAMALYAAIFLRDRVRLWVLACFPVAGVLFIIMWGPWLFPQMRGWTADMGFALGACGRRGLLNTLQYFASNSIRMLFTVPHAGYAAWLGAMLFVLPPIVCRESKVLFWWLLLFVPAALLATLDLALGGCLASFERYSFATTPAACMLVPSLASVWRGRGVLLSAVVVIACALHLSSGYEPYQGHTADYRVAAANFEKVFNSDDDALLVERGWDVEAASRMVMFYMAKPPRHLAYLTKGATPDAVPLGDSIKNVWLLSKGKILPDDFATQYRITESVQVGRSASFKQLQRLNEE